MGSGQNDKTSNSTDARESSAASDDATHRDVPDIDFTTFVLSLSTSCLVHLGDVKTSESDQADLNLAKQTIDLLNLLEQKTHGNLTGDEEQILHQVLYDLRMRFVAKRDLKS